MGRLKKNLRKLTVSTLLIYGVLLAVTLVTLLPIFYVFFGSFATAAELREKGFILFPTEWTLDAYRYLLSTRVISRSLLVSIFITLSGTAVNMLFTTTLAFAISHKNLMGRGWMMKMIVFTIVFNPGMIPNYLVIKSFHLLDTYWALLIPSAINTFNLILMKNFFQQIPREIEESAEIDGASPLVVLVRIFIPLSMSSIATFILFYAVAHWNTFLNAILYLNDTDKWPIQVWLRQVVVLSQQGFGDMDTNIVARPPSVSIKMATIVFSTLPIVIVYPFLQKYFAAGVTMGSVKG